MKELLKEIIEQGYDKVSIYKQENHLVLNVYKGEKQVKQRIAIDVVCLTTNPVFHTVTQHILEGIQQGFKDLSKDTIN